MSVKPHFTLDVIMRTFTSENGMAFPGANTTLYEAGMQLPCIIKAPGQQTATVNNEMVSWPDLLPTFLDYAQVENSDLTTHAVSIRPALTGNTLSRQAVYASHTFHEVTMYYPMRVIGGEKYKLIMNLPDGLDYPFASDLFASKTWQSVLNKGLGKLGEKPIAKFRRECPFPAVLGISANQIGIEMLLSWNEAYPSLLISSGYSCEEFFF